MVLLLNLIPFFIGAAMGFFIVRAARSDVPRIDKVRKIGLALFIGVFAFYFYTQVQPSYLPKGTVPTTLSIPDRGFEEVELPEIKNRLLSPKPEEERLEDLNNAFDWRQQIERGKEEAKE